MYEVHEAFEAQREEFKKYLYGYENKDKKISSKERKRKSDKKIWKFKRV